MESVGFKEDRKQKVSAIQEVLRHCGDWSGTKKLKSDVTGAPALPMAADVTIPPAALTTVAAIATTSTSDTEVTKSAAVQDKSDTYCDSSDYDCSIPESDSDSG